KKAGASIIVVTSGGKLAEMAKADGFPCIIIPGGQPPRTALGYMLIPVVVACEQIGLIPAQDYDALMTHIRDCVATYGIENPFETNHAKQLAEALYGKVSVVYGLGGWQGLVASRWKGQINEDSKDMTFYHVFPELNHNEILGWVNSTNQGVNKWVIITIGDGNESAKIKARVKITLELIGDRAEQHHVVAKGNTVLEKMISAAMMSDFVSCYLAALNKVDPEDISWLTYMKGELAKID
ncbi:MAG: hypothetical protein K8R88_10250, partial [Armatimonadetes bacterium]|nr:hypothetical protein [Armatimonadota bacterium]